MGKRKKATDVQCELIGGCNRARSKSFGQISLLISINRLAAVPSTGCSVGHQVGLVVRQGRAGTTVTTTTREIDTRLHVRRMRRHLRATHGFVERAYMRFVCRIRNTRYMEPARRGRGENRNELVEEDNALKSLVRCCIEAN